jgi:hypothetical protein
MISFRIIDSPSQGVFFVAITGRQRTETQLKTVFDDSRLSGWDLPKAGELAFSQTQSYVLGQYIKILIFSELVTFRCLSISLNLCF